MKLENQRITQLSSEYLDKSDPVQISFTSPVLSTDQNNVDKFTALNT